MMVEVYDRDRSLPIIYSMWAHCGVAGNKWDFTHDQEYSLVCCAVELAFKLQNDVERADGQLDRIFAFETVNQVQFPNRIITDYKIFINRIFTLHLVIMD